MPRKLKVYGWTGFPREFKGKQCRLIMAANSIKRVAELTDNSTYYLRNYAAETGNKMEVETATAAPEQLFARDNNDWSSPYTKVSNR